MTDHVEIFAKYLRAKARAGGGVSGNRKALAMHLGLTPNQVCAARDALHKAGRLVCEGQAYISIDGMMFGGEDRTPTKAGPLMTYLRRNFDRVYDTRIVKEPDKVPKGPPREVVIGDIRTSIAFAAALVLCAPGSRVSMA